MTGHKLESPNPDDPARSLGWDRPASRGSEPGNPTFGREYPDGRSRHSASSRASYAVVALTTVLVALTALAISTITLGMTRLILAQDVATTRCQLEEMHRLEVLVFARRGLRRREYLDGID